MEENSNLASKPKNSAGNFSANKLFERVPDEEYLEEWGALLAKEPESTKVGQEVPVVIFRLSTEWLALSVFSFAEIAENRPIHHVPHHSNNFLMGMVNLGGQLRLCISMHKFFEVPQSDELFDSHAKKYMLAIQKEGDFWVFPVDEIEGVYRLEVANMENVPVTVSKSAANYLKGMITWKKKSVGCIDDELLFYGLRRKAL